MFTVHYINNKLKVIMVQSLSLSNFFVTQYNLSLELRPYPRVMLIFSFL